MAILHSYHKVIGRRAMTEDTMQLVDRTYKCTYRYIEIHIRRNMDIKNVEKSIMTSICKSVLLTSKTGHLSSFPRDPGKCVCGFTFLALLRFHLRMRS